MVKLLGQVVCVLVLLAAGASATRAEEPRFWTGDPVGAYLDILGGQEGRKLEPVRIVGARNGTFSGKVVVGADGPIEAVSAQIGDLATADGKGKIPAGRVLVRPATGWIKSGWHRQEKAGSTFDILTGGLERGELDVKVEPLALKPRQKYQAWVPVGQAYVPVWVTVNVPDDAPAGEYTGTLTVKAGPAESAISRDVAVKLRVCDFVLPDSTSFRTWVETIQSPDTLAMEYNVPLWSDAHWKLIEQSLRYGAMLGNKTVYIPLIAETNLGNAESYVRWIADGKADGKDKYKHDLSIAEKYLDLQIKIQGKPQLVCFVLWDAFLNGTKTWGLKDEPEATRVEREAHDGKGPYVTLLDPATGKIDKLLLPQYGEAAADALWAPLLQRLPELLADRGLPASALCVGLATDTPASPEMVSFARKHLPGAKWVIQSHSFYGGKDKLAEYCYAAFVWGVKGFCTGNKGWEGQGSKEGFILTHFPRNMDDSCPISAYRMAAEVNITGGQRGLGRIGLDYWKVLKNKRGARELQIWARYPNANWRNLNITDSLLMPGKDGPLTTARFEMLREGVQECEARIFVQGVLDGGKLPAPLAEKCRKVLAERDAYLKTAAFTRDDRYFQFNEPSEEMFMHYLAGWQKQSEALYEVAAQAAKGS